MIRGNYIKRSSNNKLIISLTIGETTPGGFAGPTGGLGPFVMMNNGRLRWGVRKEKWLRDDARGIDGFACLVLNFWENLCPKYNSIIQFIIVSEMIWVWVKLYFYLVCCIVHWQWHVQHVDCISTFVLAEVSRVTWTVSTLVLYSSMLLLPLAYNNHSKSDCKNKVMASTECLDW